MTLEGASQKLLGKRKHEGDIEDETKDTKHVTPKLSDHVSDEENDDSDLSDDSDDEDDEGESTGITGDCEYDENEEAYPKCAAYDKDFAQVGQDLISLPSRTVKIIEQSPCDSKRVTACRTNAEELTHLPEPTREKICLLGNTGAGKSSLLNALLGLPNLAKAMAGGQACTFVSTEYESPFKGQAKKFAARVEYFDIEQIKELLTRLQGDYNAWNFDPSDDWNEDELQDFKRRAATAFLTFRSLFCDREEFESPRAAKEFLCDNSDIAIETFVTWCKDLLEEKEADESDHVEYLDADTQEELLDQLEPLVFSSSVFEEPTMWPLVKKVRIGVEGPRILKYVILVDLPGLDDTNQVRVNASYDTMRSCDSIWIVAKIDRVISETSVDSLLMRFGKEFKVLVICTGIDDNIDPGLPAHLESEGQSIGNHSELFAREKQLRKLAKKLTTKIEARRDKLEMPNKGRSKKPLTDKAKEKLTSQIERLEAELKEVEEELPGVAQERFELLVDARNSNTIRRLQEEKGDHLPKGKELEVFCVSNMHYMALKGARVINGPRLDAEATGIPALRTYILECAAPNVIQTVENSIKHDFTVFMKGLAMWARACSIGGSVQLLKTIAETQNQVEPIVHKYHDNLMTINEQQNTDALKESQEELTMTAKDALLKKKKYFWGTMRAFIRNDGNHKTSVVPKESWNEQFMEGANKIIHCQWPAFGSLRDQLGDAFKTDLMKIIHRLKKHIEGHEARMVLPMDRVNEMLEAQLEGVRQAHEVHQFELKKEHRNIKLDLTQDRHSGYFSQAMSEAYAHCKNDSGKGVKDRWLNTFETHLTLEGKRSPFAIMSKKLHAAISKDTKAKNRALSRKVENILKTIHRQFDEMVDKKIDDVSEKEVREELKRFLMGAEQKFEDIKADLARIKRRYD